MSSLVKKLNAPSLKDRLQKLPAGAGGELARKVAQRLHAHSIASEQCLLLDVSGSMAEDCGDGRSKIAALKEIIMDFPNTRKFCFDHRCEEVAPSAPGGSTDMAGAFIYVKARGIKHCVLITDGIPDSEPASLQAAGGLKIDIIYVGPPPEPPFLAKLAGLTGGQYGAGSLAQQKQITQRVQTLLLEHKP